MTPSEISAEDKKLYTLARATRARTSAAQGAAGRDLDGRTYAAATVDLASLQVSAIGAVIAMAVAGGATGLESVVVLGGDTLTEADQQAVRDFAGAGVPIHQGTSAGAPTGIVTT